MPRKPLTASQRQARREVLLAAAADLYRQTNQLPTVAQIATSAGVAKGSVYLSFQTKEEIFVALLEDGFGRLLMALLPILQQMPTTPEAAARYMASQIGALLEQQVELLSLASMSNAVLEQNSPQEAMLSFKRTLVQHLTTAGDVLETRAETLHGRGAAFLLQAWGLCIGLWQVQHMAPGLLALCNEPEFAILQRDFQTELRQALYALWLGALTDRIS